VQAQRRVLVVDGGLELAEIATKAGEFSSWNVVLASERDEAITKALTGNPDLIILGYLEPQGEAFHLHRQLKENPMTKDIPQVVVDVAPEERPSKGWQKNEGLSMEAEDYLCQPISPPELAQIVDEILADTKVVDGV
jgi:CheY-like chemotaxis protein